MKFYNKLDGKIFTFKKNDLQKKYNRYYEQLKISLNKYFDDNSLIDKISKIIVYKKIININDSYIFMNELIENLGKILNLIVLFLSASFCPHFGHFRAHDIFSPWK